MATPIENTLLAQQLFQPVQQIANNYARGNDEKVALVSRLAQLQRTEDFQRKMQTQQQDAAVNLEKLRAVNSQKLAKDTTDRQLAVTKQQQESIDRRDLEKNFSLNYPIYAQAAAVLGQKPKDITEFDDSWEGLGQLQGEMADLREQAQKHEKTEAAKGVVAVLDQATQQLKDAIKARDDGTKLTSADEAQARNMGLRALQQAATTGALPGIDPSSKKFQTAIDALSQEQPDVAVATKLLGPTGIQAYMGGVQQGLLALSNDKERLARITSLSRDVQSAQRGASESLTRLMSLAATNPELGGMLQDRSATLNSLSAPAATTPQTDTQSVFQQMLKDVPATTPQAAASVSAPASLGMADKIGGGIANLFNVPTASANPGAAYNGQAGLLGLAGRGSPQPASPMSLAPAQSPMTLAPQLQSPMSLAPSSQTQPTPSELDAVRAYLQQQQAPAPGLQIPSYLQNFAPAPTQ